MLNMLLTELIFLFFITSCYAHKEKPIVQTPLGTIRGYIKETSEGKNFAAFEGIPFAKPPTGNRRFEPPEPVEPWHGTWEATHLTECAQLALFMPNITQGDEDCLHINVYVPREHPKNGENLDVIVHIHGGAFLYGSGHMYTHPDLLITKDVILVTFNYRLGLLGFLSTEDDVISGNSGMKDQVLALEWIQQNIASFGGNPNSVTLTGASAGGASVHLHYFSEMSKGLFDRGFAQSGVALNPFSLQEGALEKSKILADSVGCPTSNTRDLVDCLKERPVRLLLNNTNLFFAYGILPIAPFAPVVEKGSKPFLKSHPYYLLKKSQVHDVPLLASNAAHEGFMFQIFVQDVENLKSLTPLLLDFNYTKDKSLWESTTEEIRKFYFGENPISLNDVETATRLFGDRTFLVGAEDAVRLQAKAAKSSVYYYLFSYPGDSGIKFVSHGADTKYYFTPSAFDPTPTLTENENKMKDLMVDMLVSFAKTGTPTFGGVDWKPTKYDKLTYLDISSYKAEENLVKTVEELTPRAFWKSLKLLENENLFNFKDEL